MEPQNDQANSRSLPPLVEGKVHGYLSLVIDEIVWSRRSPGNVTVLASWWGELDSAQFRPADLKSGESRPDSDITETYTIRTNPELFQEYLKNCETLELVVISEKNHQVVGTARVAELTNLINGKPYFQYVPILNDNGSRTGDLHVTMKLSTLSKNPKSLTKKPANLQNHTRLVPSPGRSNNPKLASFPYENDVAVAIKNAKQNENIYRSILKDRRLDLVNSEVKSFAGVNDKLVAQVVARAQRLRGAILKEARDEDPLALSEGSSIIDSFCSDGVVNDEANLYEYFLGKKMSHREEKKALDMLRTTSPTPSLIDLAAETIRSCRSEKNTPFPTERKIPLENVTKAVDEVSQPSSRIRPRETLPTDHVDSVRVAVESLTLSPAGFRRVRSSCLSRGDGIPMSVTYFVQYDYSTFSNPRKFSRKVINESRPVKLCSKKQVGQVIYFNHEAVYDLPKTYLHTDLPLKFKIFNRHLNQRTPTELGIGSMYVSDALRARSLSSTQRLAIVNKGIKIGELKVTVELGCDKIHFGKQFVEAVTLAKENIPVLEVSSVSSLESPRYRTATGSESKENAKPSSSSDNKPANSWSFSNVDRTERQEASQHRDPREGERGVEREEPGRDDSVLLYGLIYVAEGKDLPAFNTYLICRGFWREDRAISRVFGETNNPFYNFHQLVPLVHGQDLLERTRNNCIVVEMYSRRANGVDELLGISKLSLHRLYVAYRDPQVLPHLLSSKYPVISVDEWISVSHPVTTRPSGQIHALVALGTADQIALLEMTRGLRDSGAPCRRVEDPPRIHSDFPHRRSEPVTSARFLDDQENPLIRETSGRNRYESYRSNLENAQERNLKSASCQTEITTVKSFNRSSEDDLTSEIPQSRVLNVIVDRLAQALNAPKSSNDQAAQTETDFSVRNTCNDDAKMHEIEPLHLNPSTNVSFSGDSGSDADSQRGHFFPSREVYRSVGVGAEFDDPANAGPSTSYANTNSVAISNGFNDAQSAQSNLCQRKNESPNPGFNRETSHAIASVGLPNTVTNEGLDSGRSGNENSSFRAVVEIECALHLPRVEKMDETVEPCTYVTFQRARSPNETQYGCYIVTHVFPFSCSPKWDWRCDTRLSSDLLENEEKRLILKVWRLVNPETSMEINLERDIVIGFAAIDVSVLTVGFPVVSGWFHVMDFTGKCNGQIKVSVTPLDNITGFGKVSCQSSTSKPALPDCEYSNLSPYHVDVQSNGQHPNSAYSNVQENPPNLNQVEDEPIFDMGLNLGDASMSFLSLSLKQKLTELDEIKKRLQTRLQDVTNTAFDDDFDNDFDPPIVDDEDANNGNSDEGNVVRDNWRPPGESSAPEPVSMTNGHRPRGLDGIETVRATSNSNSDSFEANYTDTGYSTGSNIPSRHFSNGNHYPKNDNRFRSLNSSSENMLNGYDCPAMYADGGNVTNERDQNRTAARQTRNYRSVETEFPDYRGSNETISRNAETDNHSFDANEEHPIRGTRMHISHLLDKLTSQLTSVPPPTVNQPANKRNLMDLITSLRRNNNNFSNDTKCNREINVRTVPTQTDINYARETPLTQISNNSTDTRENVTSNERNLDDNSGKPDARNRKVSSVVREELAADEANETADCDELSTHLMTTNVRHMDLQNTINPLLYHHVIPDLRTSVNGETTNHSLINPSNNPSSMEVEAAERLDTRYTENFNTAINNGLSRLRNLMENEGTSRCATSIAGTSENDEIFRMTPSGISDNIDGNIDVTVIHKPCNDDLMASNSVDSTTTISLACNDSPNATENDDNSSLNSTETSVSGVSRQAPDGGNPVEESGPSTILKTQIDSGDSSSTS